MLRRTRKRVRPPRVWISVVGSRRLSHARTFYVMLLGFSASVGAYLATKPGFVALIALLNGFLGWVSGLVGAESLTLEQILGKVFAPLMYLISIPWEEAQAAGALFGEKIILNEFIA